MDTKADPCQDFYQYACGGWIENTKLPGDQSRWTRSFSVLRENNRALMHEILEEAAKDAKATGERKQLGSFYASCMDEQAVEAAGANPLAPIFAEISEIEDAESFMHQVGHLQQQGTRSLFGIYVGPDDKDPKMNIAHLGQGGLGLPDRAYYFDDSRKDILAAYELHIAKMFGLLGEPPEKSKAKAKAIVAFETSLAKHHLTRVERRDPDRTYNKIDRAGIEKIAPGLYWEVFAEGTGHPEISSITVDNPPYLEALSSILASTELSLLQDYLKWKVLSGNADWLSKPFVDEDFDFYARTMRGTKEQEARWKRCTSATDRAFAHPLGKLYVERAFAGESKAIAKDLIGRVEAAFGAILPSLEWMDELTRERALAKVEAIYNKIGYPDSWRDYSALQLGPTLFDNMQATRNFAYEYRASKYGKPVERDEWRSGPPVVNASYSGTRNEMWFPAGILQAPFFDREHPMAMNYGAIGVVMGHELTHGFDDQGRKFNKDGMLAPWWEESVVGEFEKRTACVDELYSKQEVEPGLFVNGKLTLGENTADMGGVKQAFAAYKTWAKEEGGDREPHVEGLTNDQLFFVSFAQVWCTVATPEYLRVQVATDPHSPGKFRANVPTSQSRDFAAAFSCDEGTPMNPKTRCEVW
jgi:predicted metalloendopeptidase